MNQHIVEDNNKANTHGISSVSGGVPEGDASSSLKHAEFSTRVHRDKVHDRAIIKQMMKGSTAGQLNYQPPGSRRRLGVWC
jgi:hypothetical protein